MAAILQRVIESPVRSAAIPCGSGEFILYTESAHSLSEHQSSKKVLLAEVSTGKVTAIASEKNDSNFKWIEPSANLIWQRRNGEFSELWIRENGESYCLGSTGVATLFQAVVLDNDELGILLYSTDVACDSTSPHSTGKVFDRLPSVTFDSGFGRLEGKVLFARASRSARPQGAGPSRYALNQAGAVNILQNCGLEWFPYSGAMPNITPPNCSMSPSGIGFVATHKASFQLGRLSSDAYFMPLPVSVGGAEVLAEPIIIPTEGCDGWSGPPAFSADGRSLALWREIGSKRAHVHRAIFIIRDIKVGMNSEVLPVIDADGKVSPLYPDSLQWNNDKTAIYFTAFQLGRQKLFRVEIETDGAIPIQVAPRTDERGSVIAAHLVSQKDSCIMTSSSFTSFGSFSALNLADGTRVVVPKQDDPTFSAVQVLEAWFESEDRRIRTNIILPPGFDESKKYPVALFVHGGPFAAWADAFAPRWCMAVFAEQGYVVLTPDFTGMLISAGAWIELTNRRVGSEGHSREFREAVYGDLGKPYRDLEACMDFVARELPYADVDRAVCLGGSYGGGMVLWIAGQPLAKRFKSLMCHAPFMFGASMVYASDGPWLWQILLGSGSDDVGNISALLDRWDPSRYSQNWTTPLFLTHGGRDNRCPVQVSLAAFSQCQFRGIESKLLVFPDESHFILKPDNAYHWYKEVIAWMDKSVKN